MDATPIWIMRQAGRYLPEYRALRRRVGSLEEFFRSPEYACEATLQPLQRYPLDAAILFSDILVLPDAMGLGLSFSNREGPRFRHPVRSAAQVDALPLPSPSRDLPYVAETVRRTLRELQHSVPLIGFAGSPWTLAAYMIEGRGRSDFHTTRTLLWQDPGLLHALLEKVAQAVAALLAEQIRAGVHAVQIFDSWSGLLANGAYQEFSLAYIRKVIQSLAQHPDTRDTPVILFSRNSAQWLPDMAACGCRCLGLDWTVPLGAARRSIPPHIALQGNLDPAALHASPQRIRTAAAQVLEEYGRTPGHIFNLGHGIDRHTNPDHLAALIDAVHELSAAQ